MNQITQARLHPFTRYYALSILFLLLTFAVSPGSARGQWTTNGTNINNTNTGNVGVGTTTPTAKQHVVGNNGDADTAAPSALTVTGGTGGVACGTCGGSEGGGVSLSGGLGSNAWAGTAGVGGAISLMGGGGGIPLAGGPLPGYGGALNFFGGTGGSMNFGLPGGGGGAVNLTGGTGGNNNILSHPGGPGGSIFINGGAGGAGSSAGAGGHVVLANLRGSVGIGTTTPAGKLHLYQGGLNLRTGINIDTAGTQASQQSELNLFTLGNGAKDVGLTGTRGWHFAARGNAYANPAEQNDLQLYSWNGSTINIRQYWDAAGNVGFGTTATPGLLNLFKTGAAAGSPVDLISFSAPGNTGTAEWNVAQIQADTNGANSADSYLAVNPISANGSGYVTGLVVKAGGNVGIGTPAPAYKLDVSGEINATGLRINGTPIGSGASSQWTASGQNAYHNTGGNVGIGTTTPIGKLDVVGASGAPNFATGLTGVLRVGAAQEHLEFGYVTGNRNWIQSFGAVPLYINEGGNNLILNSGAGNVGIGTTSPSAKLHVEGNATVSGTITGGTINAKYQDVAEWVESSQKLVAGTVVALDPEKSNQVLASSEAYDTKVAGVISVQPGISLGEPGAGKVLVATTGRVKVRVDATRAPIKIGDLLVTSDVAGFAMKSEPIRIGGRRMHAPGTLIGKALEPLATGTGEILVLLSLQ